MRRKLLGRAGGTVLAAGLLATGGTATAAHAATAPAAQQAPATPAAPEATTTATPATTTLTGAVLPGLSSLTPTGPVAASTPLDLTISLAGDPAELNSTYQAIYTPGSASYHHYLTTQQVADDFGASTSQWSAVQAWAKSAGLSVTYASPDRDILGVSGPAGAVESLLGVQLDNYKDGAFSFLANTTAPTVPTDLGIANILGLNTLGKAVPDNPTKGPISNQTNQQPTLGGLLSGLLTSASESENIGTQTAQDLWGAYDQPAADEGAGQTIASFGNGSAAQTVTDLATYEQDNGFPHVPVTVDDVGAGPFTDTSGQVEWNLDTQAEVGMAPQIDGLKLYFASTLSDADVAQLFSSWQSDPNGPFQADASFGECEADPLTTNLASVLDALNGVVGTAGIGIGFPDELEATADPILEKASVEGRTLFSSAGDTGSSCPAVALPVVGAGNGLVNQVVPLTNYPATSPYAVAVGGTTLYTDGSGQSATRAQESAWSFGGGGDTLFVPQPDYQNGVSNIDLPCISTDTGSTTATGQPCRGVPDVSAMSGDALTNDYSIVVDGSPSAESGTSLSSPLWVGMWARVQGASTNAGGNGFANETFYRLGKDSTTYDRDFNDITTGILGIPFAGNGLYTSGPGWDYATGWGSPNLANMIADVDG